ncbi:hypothetical protein GCM10009664_33820 [Kitasatospora gansuensis]
MVQQPGLGEPHPVGYLGQRGVVVAPGGEGLHRHPQDLLAPARSGRSDGLSVLHRPSVRATTPLTTRYFTVKFKY